MLLNDYLIGSLNKFISFETVDAAKNLEMPLINKIENIKFLEPSSEFRKYLILEHISKNSKTSQSELAKRSKIVPAMVNRYITEFRKSKKIMVAGDNHKKTRYYLTEEGERLRKKYLFDFINEILVLYKEIKNEIQIKLNKIAGYCSNKRIILYGANEITELILQIETGLNIRGIVDADKNKILKTKNKSIKFYPADSLEKIRFDIVIITSLIHRYEIYEQIKNIETNNKKIVIFADV
ncbi:winged helix-turn-helix domain-containing protein [Candidatus Dependentiae bacterium]|nr:winged helix-turn-helix domain-containing protein [Candidatus Dependentiae bacterium]